MSDIFLSYSQSDRNRVEKLANQLIKNRFSIWWDPDLLPGNTFRKHIMQKLKAAKCVIVLWSTASIKSHWVIDEATDGQKRGILVPALLDKVEIPMGFRQYQTAKLVTWQGDTTDTEFNKLLKAVTQIVKQNVNPSWLDQLNVFPDLRKPRRLDTPWPIQGNELFGSPFLKNRPLLDSLYKSQTRQKGIIFEDDFQENRNLWLEHRDHQTIVMRVRNGQYEIDHKQNGCRYTWRDSRIEQDHDFDIECKISHYWSVDEKSYYGLAWGIKDVNNLYTLFLSYNGYFKYAKITDGEWITMIDWKRSYNINTIKAAATKAINKVSIKKKSNVLEFHVNDSWIEDVDYEKWQWNLSESVRTEHIVPFAK